LLDWLQLPSDHPDEAGEFADHYGNCNGKLLAARRESPILRTQPGLRLPGNVLHGSGQLLEHVVLQLADARRVSVDLRTLDQGPPQSSIAGLDDPEAARGVSSRALARHKPEVAHGLPRGLEASQITHLGQDGRAGWVDAKGSGILVSIVRAVGRLWGKRRTAGRRRAPVGMEAADPTNDDQRSGTQSHGSRHSPRPVGTDNRCGPVWEA
jgi:hypothetical protein